jgi:hypothetical protein
MGSADTNHICVGGIRYGMKFGLADPQRNGKLRPSDLLTIFARMNNFADFANLFNLGFYIGVDFGVYVEV